MDNGPGAANVPNANRDRGVSRSLSAAPFPADWPDAAWITTAVLYDGMVSVFESNQL
jgi:hypothetical protein